MDNNEERAPVVLEVDGQVLTEVVVSDEPVDDMASEWSDMNSQAGEDDDDLVEANEEEEDAIVVNDMSVFKFDGHKDSVYCVKVRMYMYRF